MPNQEPNPKPEDAEEPREKGLDETVCSPCPFCGGPAEVIYSEGGTLRYEVRCWRAGCEARGPRGKRSKQEAVEVWNAVADMLGITLGALDTCAVVLAGKGHEWTAGEREIYEQSTEWLQSRILENNQDHPPH